MPARSPIQLLDSVALVSDVSELGLAAGEVGAVVEVLSDDAFEVEFCDDSGYTYGLHTLSSSPDRCTSHARTPVANAARSGLAVEALQIKWGVLRALHFLRHDP